MEEEIDLKKFAIYLWNKRKLLLYIALGFFVLANIVFFIFSGLVYSNVGKVKISSAATTEKIASYKDLILSDPVIDNAIEKSRVNANKAYVKKNLSITANMGSELYSISLNYKSKENGNKLCSFILSEFINRIESYDGNNATIYDQVVTSDKPVNFSIIKNELMYIAIGCAISLGYAFIVFYFDKAIKSEKGLEKYNILGTINNSKNSLSLIKTKIKLKSKGNVIFLNTARNINCKNEILDLVKEFSKDSKVLFIDTNIRNNLSKKIGYSDLLSSYREDTSKYINTKEFGIMECGTINNEVEVLLSSKNNERLISNLKKTYDYIILYNSNVIDYSDSLILSKLCDCNYLIVEINQTKKDDFEKAIDVYDQVNSEVDGIILIDKEQEFKFKCKWFEI